MGQGIKFLVYLWRTEKQVGEKMVMSLGQLNNSVEVRQMNQQLKTLTALTEDPSSVPLTHTKQLTTAYKFRYRGSNALFCFPHTGIHTHK